MTHAAAEPLFSGSGEMRAHCRAFDWDSTPFKSIDGWPACLREAVDICLGTAFPSFIWYGPELRQIYNDSALPIVRGRHPQSFAAPAREVWADLWDAIRPFVDQVLTTGEPYRGENFPLVIDRDGRPEMEWFTFSFSALRDADGHTAGLFIVGIETTDKVRAERARRASEARRAYLLELADALRSVIDPMELPYVATHALSAQLGACRAFYTELDGDDCLYVSHAVADHLRVPQGRYPLAPYGAFVKNAFQRGTTVVLTDTGLDSRVKPDERDAYLAVDIRASVSVPLLRNGIVVAVLGAASSTPRQWSTDEITLIEATAERTWAAMERARAESALRETQQRFHEALATARMAYWSWDSVTDKTLGSPSIGEVFGLSPGQTVESSAFGFTLVHPEDRERHRALVEDAGAKGEGWHTEFRIIRPRDGLVAWLEERATVIRDPRTGAVNRAGLVWDITDQKRAFAAAEQERREREREQLRRQLVAAEEDERRRIARDLHDQLGQHLTAFALGISDVRRTLDNGETVGVQLAKLEELAQVMSRDARMLALELRPPELDDVGFESALQTYVLQWGTRYGVETEVVTTGPSTAHRVPPDVGTALYRIVQEALTNVARHAGAKHVTVILNKPDGEARLTIEDDGRGFDVDALSAVPKAEQRLGVAGMRERAALVGGAFDMESAPGRGTTIYVRVPLDRTSRPR